MKRESDSNGRGYDTNLLGGGVYSTALPILHGPASRYQTWRGFKPPVLQTGSPS